MLGQPSELWCQQEKWSVSRCPLMASQAAPLALSWQRGLAAQTDSALWPRMKYSRLLHLRDITMSLVRRNSSGRASFLYIRSLPSPLVQTQLFLNESNGVSIMSHPAKRLWKMTASTERWMAVSSSSPDPQAELFFWKPKWGTAIRVHFWGHICKKKMIFFFFSPLMYKKKKISCFLSVFCLGMSRGVLPAQQWAQEREALEESAKTHRSSQAKTPVHWLFVAVFVFM